VFFFFLNALDWETKAVLGSMAGGLKSMHVAHFFPWNIRR